MDTLPSLPDTLSTLHLLLLNYLASSAPSKKKLVFIFYIPVVISTPPAPQTEVLKKQKQKSCLGTTMTFWLDFHSSAPSRSPWSSRYWQGELKFNRLLTIQNKYKYNKCLRKSVIIIINISVFPHCCLIPKWLEIESNRPFWSWMKPRQKKKVCMSSSSVNQALLSAHIWWTCINYVFCWRGNSETSVCVIAALLFPLLIYRIRRLATLGPLVDQLFSSLLCFSPILSQFFKQTHKYRESHTVYTNIVCVQTQ